MTPEEMVAAARETPMTVVLRAVIHKAMAEAFEEAAALMDECVWPAAAKVIREHAKEKAK